MLHTDMVDELALANTNQIENGSITFPRPGSKRGIVVGTGNKVEDFGVGFYTKYGDGGVDISPSIADLMNREVWELGKELGVLQERRRTNRRLWKMVEQTKTARRINLLNN